MGPAELAVVLALVAAVSAGTWASRDVRARTGRHALALVTGTAVALTFPIGPALYARVRHRLGAR